MDASEIPTRERTGSIMKTHSRTTSGASSKGSMGSDDGAEVDEASPPSRLGARRSISFHETTKAVDGGPPPRTKGGCCIIG
jgi:hypothetical protein